MNTKNQEITQQIGRLKPEHYYPNIKIGFIKWCRINKTKVRSYVRGKQVIIVNHT